MYFNRIPHGCKTATTHDNNSLNVENVTPYRGIPSIPSGVDRHPLQGYTVYTSTGGEIIHDNTNNNINNICEQESSSLEKEKDILISSIKDEFGYLECVDGDILNAEHKASMKTGYNINRHISLLQKLKDNYQKSQTYRIDSCRRNYLERIQKTLSSPLDLIKKNLIVDKFKKENNITNLPLSKYGVWVDSWNKENNEPNFITSFMPVPDEVINKMNDNIENIPREYYKERDIFPT